MPKSTVQFWNVLGDEAADEWRPIEGAEDMEYILLAKDEETGNYTRLVKFPPGADTTEMGEQAHDYQEEMIILKGSLYDKGQERTVSVGEYTCRPIGEKHGPFVSEDGCILMEVAYPGDVEQRADGKE